MPTAPDGNARHALRSVVAAEIKHATLSRDLHFIRKGILLYGLVLREPRRLSSYDRVSGAIDPVI